MYLFAHSHNNNHFLIYMIFFQWILEIKHNKSMLERGSHECGNVMCCKFDQSSCRLRGSKVAAQPQINRKATGEESGAVPPGVHLAIPPSPLMFPSTIMGTHTCNFPCMCNQGYIPTWGYVLTTRRLEGCLWMLFLWGVGPLVRSWGEL